MNSVSESFESDGTAPRLRLPAGSSRWLRDPLLHFLVLGALLFLADYAFSGRTDDPTVIVIDESVDREALRIFAEKKGRKPNADELYALRQVWLDNEVLYREGVALKLDQGDPAIRDRVIFKALSIVEAGLVLPPVDDAKLEQWFERNRVKYDEPPRFDFEEAVIANDPSEGAARDLATALNHGSPGDTQAGLHIFRARPLPTIVQSYGPDFAEELERAPIGEWQVLKQRDGWRVVRVTDRRPATAASFDELRDVVRQDWTDATMSELRTRAVRTLADKYTVRIGTPGP
jgi:hypothetical protein